MLYATLNSLQGYLVVPGDVFVVTATSMLLASSRLRLGMLLNILVSMGHLLSAQNHLAPNSSDTEAGKPGGRVI